MLSCSRILTKEEVVVGGKWLKNLASSVPLAAMGPGVVRTVGLNLFDILNSF